MARHQTPRGLAPRDERLFAARQLPALRAAAADLCWLFDQPVSNSGRLKALILEEAARAGWNMEMELTFSPDHVLSHTGEIIASRLPQARLLDLAPTGD